MVKARKPGKAKREERGPSLFFVIALILGFVVLVWWFLHFLPKRATGEEQGRAGRAGITDQRVGA